MTKSITYRITILMCLLVAYSMNAQSRTYDTNDHKVDDYIQLVKNGYADIDIFQDLGNAQFLAGNYESAIFWYEKLLQIENHTSLLLDYKGLLEFSLVSSIEKTIHSKKTKSKWDAHIRSHYTGREIQNTVNLPKMKGELSTLDGYMPEMTVTQNGKIGYYSKAVHQKPLYGVFSKKELIHEIYRVERIDGEWRNPTKVKVCPKYASAKHPAISQDGKRLFFASNMKGSYGKYDIYVVDIKSNGTLGMVKNLGAKVNTKADELYPNLYNGTLLFFASSGRQGYGGLDLYATQVAQNRLTASVNLGNHINSSKDEYSIALNVEKGTGYVVSNRGQNSTIAQHLVSYGKDKDKGTAVANREDKFNSVIYNNSAVDYSATSYEDK